MYYESYFNLREAPFSISPDPRYLYLTQNHREALAHLLYGVSSNGGFVLLTGEIGAGKTTICQCLLEQLPENTDVAYILNPKLETWEFLATVCDDLGILYPSDNTGLKLYIDLIREHLLEVHAKGRNTVLMVDEAQNLSTELIEHLRLLTNLETHEKKLLQIMLVGQPELRDKIALPEMQQMAQRITARYHLGPLSKKEVASYVRHRLKVAGAEYELFTQGSLKFLWKFTGGVPRLINIICDRALLGTYTSKQERVDHVILQQAAQEVLGRNVYASKPAIVRWVWGGVALSVMGIAFAGAYYFRNNQSLSGYPTAVVAAAENLSPFTWIEESSSEKEVVIINGSQLEQPVQEENIVERTADKPLVAAADDSLVEVSAHRPMPSLYFPQNLSSDVLELSAFNALFHRWDINYLPEIGVDPCQFAASERLGCLRGQGNLPILQLLDRPALVTLYDQQGQRFSASLLGVSESDVVLVLGGEVQRVPTASLPNWWYGEYLVLWHMPSNYRFPLKVGASGVAVVWLLQQLGETLESTDNHVYSKELESKVKLFQRSHSLVPDGIVGPRTIIALNNQSVAEGPRLMSQLKE